ncbi:zinc-ribbon domain-containing protein [Curtobacterium sp. RRHDQ10]|uniref:zinc-ribbon domain-containing protein n=1 Tax=Curtobacterium phyllosphaerae TaxID=3413379 RepID=UPI003BF3D935
MIIFGTRGMSKLLGVLFYACAYCHQEAAQRLVQRATWFTLFFIPVFPFSTRRTISCAYCGGQTDLDKETAERFVADSQRFAASSSPQTQPGTERA